MSIICPRCGRNDSQVKFIDAFCVDDYPVRVEAPKKIEIKTCRNCSMMFLKGEWMPYSEKKISAFVESKCKGDFTEAKYDIPSQTVRFTIEKGGNRIEAERFTRLEKTVTTCPRCSRISGGYFEAIVQIRGERKNAQKLADSILKRLAKLTFISKTDEKDEGIDIYAGDSKAVVQLMSELGIRTLITKKLVGRDEGKSLYRTTFLIRL